MIGDSLEYPRDLNEEIRRFWEGDGGDRRLVVNESCKHGRTDSCVECVQEAVKALSASGHKCTFNIPVEWAQYPSFNGSKIVEVKRLKCAHCEAEKVR